VKRDDGLIHAGSLIGACYGPLVMARNCCDTASVIDGMNMAPDLQKLDLNLLRVFDAVYRLRRVSHAADALDLSQPALSNALARLRLALGDPLFSRIAVGVAPTPLADRIAPAVNQALRLMTDALTGAATFEPASSNREFALAMSDIGQAVFLPPLTRRLQKLAPGICLRAVPLSLPALQTDFESGAVDLAIGFLPGLAGGLFHQRLFMQRYVLLLRTGHPALAQPMSVKRFTALRHLVVQTEGTGHRVVEQMLQAGGARRNVAVRVPGFLALAYLLRDTDLVATVPTALAAVLTADSKLTSLPHPMPLPEFEVAQFWHRRTHEDAACTWLRQQVQQEFQAAPAVRKAHSARE
jgi:DNA-binding transcriptional LysR family regulator